MKLKRVALFLSGLLILLLLCLMAFAFGFYRGYRGGTNLLTYSEWSREPRTYDRFVVYYFGGSTCPGCTMESTLSAIDTIRQEFPKSDIAKNRTVKFVCVCMDRYLRSAMRFVGKCGPWDEISIGGHYKNEILLQYLKLSEVPGVPQLMIFSDKCYHDKEKNCWQFTDRTLVLSLVGPSQMQRWISNGYALDDSCAASLRP